MMAQRDERERREARSRWAGIFAAGIFAAALAVGVAKAEPSPKGAGAGALPSFAKGPYIQALGQTGVTVKLELSTAERAQVEVFPAGASVAMATQKSSEAKSFHALRIEGLSPATSYDYRVTAAGAVSEIGHFSTAPAADKPFKFVVYGDSRSDGPTHASVVKLIEKAPADFLVNTGDMVITGHDTDAWKEFFSIEGKLLRDRCVFASVGNHELRGDPRGEVAFLPYFASFEDGRELTQLHGSFRWGNTRIFVLNAMDNWTGAERDWLRVELDRALVEPGLVHRFALMHWGPFSSGRHGGNQALASGEIIGLMREKKVELIMSGHDHDYERGEGSGLKYVVSGGSGAPLYPRHTRAPQTIVFESTHHFVEMAVDGERVSLLARRASGSVIETCGFKGSGSWDCGGGSSPESKPAPTSGHAREEPAGPATASAAKCGCEVVGGTGEGAAGGALVAAALGVGVLWRRKRSNLGAEAN